MLELDEKLLFQLRAERLVYVATPYSKYDMGIDRAWDEACRATAQLIKEGVAVYSPIAHSHPIALIGGLDPLDHKIWLPANTALINASLSLLVVQMPGWAESYGVKIEIDAFRIGSRSIFYAPWRPDLPLG